MRYALLLATLLLTLSVFSLPTFSNGIVPPANAVSASFSFAASGDMGSLTVSTSVNSLNRLVSANPNFFLGLGDFSYDPSVTGDIWCGEFKSSFNGIQILPGDHDTGGHASGFPETHDYAKYLNGCPLTLSVGLTCGPVSGNCYGKEYFFDYPALNPIARVVFASPKIYNITGVCNSVTAPSGCSSQTGQPCTDQYGCWQYTSGDVHYNWVSNAIDSARATGIKWVIVATHKLCISASDATCSMGLGFFNMLVQKKVDLIIQAHDNAYERSKQIALNGATGCSSITTDINGYAVYNSGCIVDAGTRGYYTPGAGSVVVVQGAWINDLYTVNNTSSNGGANAAETPYFVKLMGSNTAGNGLGFTQYTISASRIDVTTNFSGTYSDSFSIWGGSSPVPSASWSPLSPQVGQAVTFTASATGGVAPYSFTWDFGDGGTAAGTTVSHAYASANYFNVTLTTIDSANNIGSFRSVIAVGSWNPNVPCVPSLTPLSTILGSAYPSQSLAGSQWQTNSTAGGIPNKRALSPPCTLTNINGQSRTSYVEVDNVYLPSPLVYEDCDTSYDPVNGGGSYGGGKFCDSTGNVFSVGTSSGFLHIEFDHDWMAKGYCGPASTICNNSTIGNDISNGSIPLDIQGFVFWDSELPNPHWEIHAITGWRLHQSNPPLSASFTFSPSQPQTNQQVTFTASGNGGATPYSFSWTFGDGSTGTGSIVTHAYTSAATFIVVLTVKDSGSPQQTATSQQSVTVTNPAPLTASFTYSPSSPVNGQQVTFTASASGGTSPYTFSWSFGDGGSATGTPTTHVYSASGSYTVTLTTGDSANHTAVVSNNVVVSTADFKLAANPLLLTVQRGQNTQSQIAVTSLGGFHGTVALSASVSSTGLTVSMQNPSVTLAAGQTVNDNLKVAASKTAPTGIFIVIVTGTSGLLVHSLNVTVRVPDFNMTANPVTLTASPGSTGSSQVLFQSLFGFQGGISTTVSVSPAGPKATLNPNNPSLTVNGTKSSVLSVQVPSNQAPGVYNVTIKATSGSLLHLLIVQVHVGQHTSATVVNCSPSSVVVNQASTCTATVTDTSTGSTTTPTGTVTFAETGPAGSFSSTTCTLSSGSCSVTFTPTATGTALITGAYGGDTTYNTSTSASASVTVDLRTTTTTVNCSPSSVSTGQTTTCIATVADSSPGTAATPAGAVTFNQVGVSGSFVGSPCSLVSGSCSATFSASTIGTANITGAYMSSDTTHSGSTSVAFPVTVASVLNNTTTAVSCAGPVVVNQASSCTATVTDTNASPTTPTGTVSFTETGPAGSFTPTTCTLVSASCSVTFTPTATGNALVTGTYGGDSSHGGSTSAAASITVNSRTTSTALVCSSPVVVNQASSCTATVSDTSPGTLITPTGSVNFTETGAAGSFSSATCNLVSGGCSVTFTATATGTATITAAYSGDAAHAASISGPASVIVNPRTTSTTIVCTSPIVVNQASNCTVTVTDSSSGSVVTPTGSVSFVSDSPGTFSATSCTVTAVSTGVTGCSVSYTPGVIGNHLISGSYSGDTVHSTSNGASTITVGQRSTGTTVACAPTGVGVDQACTATVTDNSPGTVVTPVGSVKFTTNSTGTFSSNACNLSATGTTGVVSCQVTYTPVAVATHTITGTYSGDTVHLSSQGSASIGFGKDSTTTTIACSPSSVAINQATTCAVTVTDTASIGPTAPTGTVDFTSNAAGSFTGSPCTLASQTATSSSCQVTYTPTSGAGTHSITATHNGDSVHSGSTSQAFALTVTLRTTSTTVSCSPSSVVVNQATSCTAVVADSSGSGGTTPTGNVVFTPGGSCALVGGSCSVSVTPSSSGSLSISASYGGDSSHGTSSGGATVTVSNRSTSTSVSCSPSPVTSSTATSCVATVTDTDVGGAITPSGSAGFTSNSTGVFTQPSCILAATGTVGVARCSVNYTPGVTGSHAITASYAGDSSHLGSSGSVTVTVVSAAPKPAYALVVSADGKVSRLYQNGTLTLIGQPVTTALRSVAWKPDGSYALISGDFAVLLKYDGTTLTTIPTGISTGFNFWTVSWKPDGSYALVGGTSGILFKYDGVKVTTIPNASTTILSINWQPSGSAALLVGKSGLALTYDGTTVRSFATGTTFDLDAAAWNPNGAYALIGGLNRTLLTFNGTAIAVVNTSIIPPNNAIRAISFNPTGSLALLAGDSGMVLTWNGSTLTVLPTLTSSFLYSISWSPSGTAYIAGGSGTVLTYTNGTLAKLATSPVTTTQYRAIAWKPQ